MLFFPNVRRGILVAKVTDVDMYFEKLPSSDYSSLHCLLHRVRTYVSIWEFPRTLQLGAFELYSCDSLVVRCSAAWDLGIQNALSSDLWFFSIRIYSFRCWDFIVLLNCDPRGRYSVTLLVTLCWKLKLMHCFNQFVLKIKFY